MADIDLERKQSAPIWPWIVGALLLALVVWGLAEAFDSEEPEEADIEMVDPADSEPVAQAGALTLAMILENPGEYIGQTLPDGVYRVASVPTDRGFMIQNQEGGPEFLAILIDEPREQPDDINEGQRVRITGGTLRAPSYLSEIQGVPLDDDTRRLADAREVFLVVDERNVEVIAGG